MDKLIYLVPVMGVIGLLYTFIKFAWVSKQDAGNERMQEISKVHCRRRHGLFKSGMENPFLFRGIGSYPAGHHG
jgi:hypothetical protein